MSTKFNLLLAVSVMSVVYMAGVSNTANAVNQVNKSSSSTQQLIAVDMGNADFVIPAANAAGQQRYIIRFKEPALARYNSVGEQAAIPRNPDNSILVNSSAVQSYVAHLKQQQDAFLSSLSGLLGRNVNALLTYQYSYNGMAVNLSTSEAATVKGVSQVAEVQLDKDYKLNTDAGPQLIGADNIWTGTAPAAGTALGEGVVIATLDTGINFDHPSFADVGDDAYDHTNPLGAGNFLGVCDPANTDQFDAAYTCNDKLMGGYDFVNDLVPMDGSTDIPGPEDENGHGSHTASTSGGNVVSSAEASGITGIAISGVAPHATVIIFDTCFNNPAGQGLCPGASAIASVDQALADGLVNVINYSIGGGVTPWTDPVSQAFLSATDSGIFVATSAGNSGPGPGTLGHVEPWTSSSGASTHNRFFENLLSITGPGAIDPSLEDISYLPGNGPAAAAVIAATINYSGIVDAANVEGCNPFPASSFDGQVALISRGACAFADKVNNAEAAGAIAVIVHNNVVGLISMIGLELTNIPAVSILQTDGAAMVTFITANPTATVQIELPAINLTGQADVMAGFSSRGPSPFEYNKPDVAAPGVSILAAVDDGDVSIGTAAEYGVISGTSMASPHNAGSAALMKELNPAWSAAEIKSALMMTAVTAGVTKEDASTPADPFDRGAGRIQVDVASSTGLVMDETAIEFSNADPDNGGDPKTLNVPSITDYDCFNTCSFTRRFTSVAATSADYSASLTGFTGTVSPSTFTVNPGDTIALIIEINSDALVEGDVNFGELVIIDTSVAAPGPTLHLPVVIIGSSDLIFANGFEAP